MSEKQAKDDILELIQLVDRNKARLFKNLDIFHEWRAPFTTFIVVLIFLEFFFIFGGASESEKLGVGFAFIAVFIGFMEIVAHFALENLVKVNFKRLENCIEEDKKPILKALVKMKTKNQEFDLEQIYNMDKAIFTKEKLLELLYD